jgi:hypothetical protein
METFNQYAENKMVECASGKSLRSHLDVTSQCLRAEDVKYSETGIRGVKLTLTHIANPSSDMDCVGAVANIFLA